MPKTRNLLECSSEQVQEFLDSLDVVLTDCDGVLWNVMTKIEGALETLTKLQQMGKEVYFVTNNSLASVDQYCQKLRALGVQVEPDHIINTATVITWYLKKINFTGEIYTIASTAFRQALENAGYNVILGDLATDETDIPGTLMKIQDRPSIKAVIVDVDVECSWVKLAFAITCLSRNDVLYFCGALDEWVYYDSNRKILGPGPLTNIITRQSGKTPTNFGKPSEVLKSYISQKCKVQNPSRCIFIGDTIHQDMKFGTLCGFKKLLVETGCDNLEDALKFEETTPDYFIPSLGQLGLLIDSLSVKSINNKNG